LNTQQTTNTAKTNKRGTGANIGGTLSAATSRKRLASEKDLDDEEYESSLAKNGQNPAKEKSRKRRRKSKKLTKQDFINHFHLTQPEAARALDVCLTTFKNQFSKYPLRWPTPSERKLLIKQRRRQNLPNESFSAFIENMTVTPGGEGSSSNSKQNSGRASSHASKESSNSTDVLQISNMQYAPQQGIMMANGGGGAQHIQGIIGLEQQMSTNGFAIGSDTQIDQMMNDLQTDIENQKRKNELLRMLISQQNDVLREISMSYQVNQQQGSLTTPNSAAPHLPFPQQLTPQQHALFVQQQNAMALNSASRGAQQQHLYQNASHSDPGSGNTPTNSHPSSTPPMSSQQQQAMVQQFPMLNTQQTSQSSFPHIRLTPGTTGTPLTPSTDSFLNLQQQAHMQMPSMLQQFTSNGMNPYTQHSMMYNIPQSMDGNHMGHPQH